MKLPANGVTFEGWAQNIKLAAVRQPTVQGHPLEQYVGVAAAQNIISITNGNSQQTSEHRYGAVFKIIDIEETPPIPLNPNHIGPGETFDCATVGQRTESRYHQSRLRRAFGGLAIKRRGQCDIRRMLYVRLSITSGTPEQPHDPIEEIKFDLAPPLLPGLGEPIDPKDPQQVSSMHSFLVCLEEAAVSLRAAGRPVDLPQAPTL